MVWNLEFHCQTALQLRRKNSDSPELCFVLVEAAGISNPEIQEALRGRLDSKECQEVQVFVLFVQQATSRI